MGVGSFRSSPGVKCGLDNGVEEFRCSSICEGATRGTKRHFNPFIRLPERIQPDTRHPPCRSPLSGPNPPNPPTPVTSSHPSSRVALQEPRHSHQILISLLMTRRFGYSALSASLLWDDATRFVPTGGEGFLPVSLKTKCLFSFLF